MYNLISILGPTATGKTKLAAMLACEIGGEIISADSRQVYRGMDIGTGKDLDDYIYKGNVIPHHLLNIADPGYEYNIFEFQNDFDDVYQKITKKGAQAILCGGSGMYLDAILRNYSLIKVPENKELRAQLSTLSMNDLTERLKTYTDLHNKTDITDRDRTIRAIEIAEYQNSYPELKHDYSWVNSINIGIHFERSVIRNRITQRLKARLDEGMIDEVQGLLDTGLKPEQLFFYGLEYKFVTRYIIGDLSYEEMFTKLNTAIHQFSKRQMTWFRRMQKNGVLIHWIDGRKTQEEKLAEILQLLAK